MKLVIGISCDRGVSLQTLEQAINAALKLVNIGYEAICLIATVDQKSDEAAILELAKQQQWRLQFYPTSFLAQTDAPMSNTIAPKYLGAAGISQAAALLAANTQQLLMKEYKYRGDDGKNATIALAQMVD